MKYSIEIFWFKSDTFFSQTYFKESSMSTPYECSVSCNVIQEPIPLLPSRQTRKNCIPRLPRAAHAGSHVPLLSSDNIQSVPFFILFHELTIKLITIVTFFVLGLSPGLTVIVGISGLRSLHHRGSYPSLLAHQFRVTKTGVKYLKIEEFLANIFINIEELLMIVFF